MLAFVAVAAISSSATVAPRVEIYTRTICAAHGLDPDADAGYERCRTTPAVQADAAQLMAVISTLSGLLTTLTAAWWGSVSPLLVLSPRGSGSGTDYGLDFDYGIGLDFLGISMYMRSLGTRG